MARTAHQKALVGIDEYDPVRRFGVECASDGCREWEEVEGMGMTKLQALRALTAPEPAGYGWSCADGSWLCPSCNDQEAP